MEFCKKKQKNLSELEQLQQKFGDFWIWCAFEPRVKILVSFLVGKHTVKDGMEFLRDVKERSDGNIPLLTSDELPLYPDVILKIFGKEVPQVYKGRGRKPSKKTWVPDPQLDYAQVVKTRENGRVVSIETKVIFGDPKRIAQKIANSPVSNSINTSFVERSNGTLRQDCSRLSRKTFSYSKKSEMLEAHLFLFSAYYHFCRPHFGLRQKLTDGDRKWREITPAMAAGITDRCWSVKELLAYPMLL